ncbi:MAG: hypothetical protein FK733_06570 [Asgard group archaeon]|nr:hypothetical protein [Asgard group archaeon]
MKYSLTKKVNKEALVELFMMLSDSIDEDIPDIIWEGSEFEVDIKQPNVNCLINYVAAKKGGEFNIKISWITPAAKKEKDKEKVAKTKEKIEKTSGTKSSPKGAKKSQKVGMVDDEELWLEDEDNWEVSSDDGEWDSEDYDEEW